MEEFQECAWHTARAKIVSYSLLSILTFSIHKQVSNLLDDPLLVHTQSNEYPTFIHPYSFIHLFL